MKVSCHRCVWVELVFHPNKSPFLATNSIPSLQSAASTWRESHPAPDTAATASHAPGATTQASTSGRYPQLPWRAAAASAQEQDPAVSPPPSSTQRLRDEIARLNLNIAERNRAAGVPAEGVEVPAEGGQSHIEGEGLVGEGVPQDGGGGDTEEDLPSAPTHRIPARAAGRGARVAAQYAD